MTRHLLQIIIFTVWITAVTVVTLAPTVVCAQNKPDTTRRPLPGDSLHFPIHDRRGDQISSFDRNPLNLKNPSNLKDSIEYDPKTNLYYLVEKIGNKYYRTPTSYTYEEYLKLTSQQSEENYFRQRADMLSELNHRLEQPKLNINNNLFNRLFGNGKIDIRPQGNVDILAGYQGQNVQNPTLPEAARKTGGLDFNMDANVNVLGNIGSKLKLPISYNTQASFDWMNQLKLEYTGGPDDIVKKIEVGNTSFTTRSTLMSSQQSLFGIKTQLQFGKLFVTGVIASQRSQSQSTTLQGGASLTTYMFKADDYDENRHFLLAQFFRNNYNRAMSNLPVITSQVQILRMEVWVTNRNGTSTQARQVVGLMDLGEPNPYNPNIKPLTNQPYPFNDANSEYRSIINNPGSRMSTQVIGVLTGLGLTQVQDYEQVYARKLNATDYTYNQQVGFISLNQTLQPNDVLGVAFQYSYNGKIYQVGEFSQDVPPDTTLGVNPGAQKVIYLKLLKATAQRTTLPIWDLMMKNIYTLKTGTGSYLANIQPAGFQMNILYEQAGEGTKRYLPAGDKSGIPLITVLNLDRLNAHLDPQPDGVFDYVEGFTVVSSQARIIFPLLEPFGKDLAALAFANSPGIDSQYVFTQLYDTIKEVAKTFAAVDKYYLSGVAKGTASSDISLGAFNVPQGSVRVTAGGQILRENIDYTVDYTNGSVKVINPSIIQSGVPVHVAYENNASYGTQQQGFMGLRLDYVAKNTAQEALSIGGTIERLNERPYFTKTNYGEDPIRNTMYGLDVNYRAQWPGLTRLLNKMPWFSSKEMSTITAVGEAAYLQPGHPPQIGKGSSGTIYIDDFEGSTSSVDLRFPITSWALASTPAGNGLFPEATLSDSLPYGYNRSKFAWYNIEPTLQDRSSNNNPVKDYQNFQDPRVYPVNINQLFPTVTPEFGQAQLITFDVSYFPNQKGPYNFDTRPGSMDPSGNLTNPASRWGGIMRAIDQTDFETSNVQYIEFWMQSPFLTGNNNGTGGQLYMDLGSISEDVLKDGRKLYENGLNTPNIPAAMDNSSVWGRVPFNAVQTTNAFSNDPSDRPYQDQGFDGMNDSAEQVKFSNYLDRLAVLFGTGSAIYQNALNDPAADDYLNYRAPSYDATQTNIIGRYKNINNPQGNSPIAPPGATYVDASTLYPDQEDLDHDNTMNTLEEYFEYKVDLIPGKMRVGQNFITDSTNFYQSDKVTLETWYQFRIPINAYSQKVGNIPDFKSIRFIRMYMHGWTDSVVCRFAEFQLIRDSWRNFNYLLDTTGTYTPIPANSPTTVDVTAVNIEQNSTRTPINYVIPPGVERQQQLSTNNVNLLLNEQSMSLQICELLPGEARGVYKNTNYDLRRYGTMQMFIHAESRGPADNLQNNQIAAVIRLGSDFINNFYEVRIPLEVTPWGTTLDTKIWPDSNSLNLTLQRLVQLKTDRNATGNTSGFYQEIDVATKRVYSMFGNPNLGQVQAMFLGVENISPTPVCTEVWFDELRLSNLNDQGGYAANGRVDIKLADLGTLYLSAKTQSIGFGSIDQSINERALSSATQWDVATQLELGKLLPKNLGLSIPFYGSWSKSKITPEYDPYDLDITLAQKIAAAPPSSRDSIEEVAVDESQIRSFNFTNVRRNNITGKKLKIWSIENFDFSYSYTRTSHHNPIALEDELTVYKGGLGYNFVGTPKYWEPFKKMIKSRSAWYSLFRDFNLNPVPAVLTFRGDVVRQYGAYQARNVGGGKYQIPETFNKFFTIDRTYIVRWDITRSLNIDFAAINKSWVDEDSGRLDKAEKKQMWKNFWKGGRTIAYNQTANFTYTVPTTKIPFLDWTTLRLGYGSSYQWTGASTLATQYGNFIQNTQKKDASADLNLTRLYAKWRLLRELDQPTNAPPPTLPGKKNDSLNQKNPQPDYTDQAHLKGIMKALARIITCVKDITINYSEISASSIYGYTDTAHFLGMNLKSNEPGWGYVFGEQPDTSYVNRLAKKGLLTTDTLFNFQNQASFNQILSISAQIQPVRDLNITLNVSKSFGKNYTELYKDTTGNNSFVRLNPYTAGSFSVSFISVKTLFESNNANQISSTFQTFENYRSIISQRLGKLNPYSGGIQTGDGYAKGYGKYAQDVLIPAFIAAYSGKSPNSIALVQEDNPNIKFNPFSGYMPKPNWRLTYNGLSRIPAFQKIFTNFSISDGYTSTLSMNTYNSNLSYQDPFGVRQPGFIDTLTGNFVPYFMVPNITISEQFAPLIDLDMQFVNQLQAKFSFSKSRQLSLSLIDYQMSETRSSEYIFGLGFRKRGVPLPFKIKVPGKNGPTNRLENDLTLRLDLSFRDDATTNSYLDQNAAVPVGGQEVISISPSIDYVINNRINLKFYFDERRTIPKISSSPPVTTTRAGIQIRISLAELAAQQPKPR